MTLLRRATAVVILPAALTILGACGSGSDGAEPGPSTTGTTEPTPSTVATTQVPPSTSGTTGPAPSTTGTTGPDEPEPSADEVLVAVHTSGTISGRGIGNLVISSDGQLQHTDVQGQVENGSLSPDELDELVRLLEAADFAAAPTRPTPDQLCPDAVVYAVTYRQWEISADDCTIPAEIEPVLHELTALMHRFD